MLLHCGYYLCVNQFEGLQGSYVGCLINNGQSIDIQTSTNIPYNRVHNHAENLECISMYSQLGSLIYLFNV